MSTSKSLPIIEADDWLKPVEGEINYRHSLYTDRLTEIEKYSGTISDYANAHHYFGFHYDPEHGGWWFREWLPEAREVFIFGDFNDWERTQFPLHRDDAGVWSIFIADAATHGRLKHQSHVKMYVHGADGSWLDRIPAYIRRVVQNDETKDYVGQVWNPVRPFDWRGDTFDVASVGNLLIYESHVGMAQEIPAVGSYKEFTAIVLPWIKNAGYNAIQLMAIAEHPYYGSFGYHVANFFAPSSRFGTPEELKELIRTAHSMGLAVIMDLVHSHYVKNMLEGINRLDGSDHLYSPSGEAGDQPYWDSKLFNYRKYEVQHFLLSNIKYWLDEFHFDGFRFDGVTSMLYFHHGYVEFDARERFFDDSVNRDAITYLTLANKLIHEFRPSAVTIAEDVSGMPGMCIPIEDGGVGFDYRLGMAIPDFWIKYLKEVPDEDWDIHLMWNVLMNRLPAVGTVTYCESHDQALVGDKTLAFRLMDKEMYFSMDRSTQSIIVDRGVALHKMIRFFTILLGGQAYLNFMGNEFGHPEWIDFPRDGNAWSYDHARRQWSLAEAEELRYIDLLRFDKAMINFVKRNNILGSGYAWQLNMDEANKTITFAHKDFVFVFNWHPTASIADYTIPMPDAGKYKVILNTDDTIFGGFGRVDESIHYFTKPEKTDDGNVRNVMNIYNVNRTAQVFKRIE